ncbi:putative GTP-binding protein [Candidatus Magnetomoraceae bacterium gMMP-1]
MNFSKIPIFKRIKELDQLAKGILLCADDQAMIRDLSEKVKKELEKAAQMPLKIGLAGGTGVGKSTIINFLAGQNISEASHRRPHTDRIVIYHHENIEPVFHKDYAFFGSVISHNRDNIQHVILCDMPDFDSLITAHRKMVQDFVMELDLLLWVSSPEKYGDRAMFNLMDVLQKSSDNFCFVLNKIDQLNQEETQKAVGHFSFLLGEASLSGLSLFPVSAKDALESRDTPGAKGMDRLKQWIFKKRQEKELVTIKSKNLDQEIQALTQSLADHLESWSPDIIKNIIKQTHDELDLIEKKAQKEILNLIDPNLGEKIISILEKKQFCLWPVNVILPFVKRITQHDEPIISKQSTLKNSLTVIDRLIAKELIRFPGTHPDISLVRSFDQFIKKLYQSEDLINSLSWLSYGKKWGFFIKQWIYLCIPFIFFIFYMLGIERIEQIGQNLSLVFFLKGLVNIVFKIFTFNGLIALISLIVIESFISLRLAGTKTRDLIKIKDNIYNKLSEKTARHLLKNLNEHLKELEDNVNQAEEEYRLIKR